MSEHSPPVNPRATRSTTKLGLQPSATPQIATQEKKKAKAKEAKENKAEARKILMDEKVLNDRTGITLQTLTKVLLLIVQKYSTATPHNLIKVLQALATLMQETSNTTLQITPTMETLTQKLGERVERSLQEEMAKLSDTIKSSMAEQCKAASLPDSLAETVASLKQVATDMTKTVGEATMATSNITDTTHSYKQVLLQAALQAAVMPQPSRTMQADPRILRDIDRKDRQILVDTIDPKVMNASLAEIKEKVHASIATITNPPPPQDTTIIDIGKLCKGGVTILFKEKDAIIWVLNPAVKQKFLQGITQDAALSGHTFPLRPHLPHHGSPHPHNLRPVKRHSPQRNRGDK